MSAFGRKVLSAAQRQWRPVVLLFVLMAAGGVAFLTTLPTSYTATSVVSFQPREDQLAGASLVELLASRYPALAESTPVIGAAASAAGVSASTLRAGLVAAVAPSTLNLTLSTTLSDPGRAVAANQSLYQSLVEASQTDIYLEALEVEQPSQVSQDASLPLPISIGVTVLLAAVVAAFVGLVLDYFRNRTE